MAEMVRYRIATLDDAEAILEIYAPYVESTAVTFEFAVPSLEEFRGRIQSVLEQYPYLVAESDGEILGYAYASGYRPRAGFFWTPELSVYVKQGHQEQGIGTHLYAALLDLLRLQGYQNVCSVLSWPNPGSEKLHQHFGFRFAGLQKKCGYKHGEWRDVAIFERRLGDYPVPPPQPLRFSQLPWAEVERILKF